MKLIIIANRLPIKVIQNEDNKLDFIRSEGGLTTGLDSLEINIEKHWVGWPGISAETPEDKLEISNHLKKSKFHPVFLTEEEIENYYEGYSNSTLWPLCHYFYNFIDHQALFWDTYEAVNKLFYEAALKIIEPGDIVWVQDYQLMLLPNMLRESGIDMSIGYFHHIPFPSYELFRILPERVALVNGLLGADLIGFHTHDYMRHFVSTCERILDLRFDLDQVSLDNRIASADVFPMGINYTLYHEAPLVPEAARKAIELREEYGDKKLILSVDRLDYSKGILSRIQGFERFLEQHPEYHDKVSLVMIVVPSRDTVDSYSELKTKIDEAIGAINGKYSSINWTPLYYFYHGFDFNELIAMYHIADIALITPLRDGMNLVTKEYIAAKRDTPGVLILSEMAGAAIELSDALIINPHDTNMMADSLYQALNMPEEEQRSRLKNMQKKIAKHTVNFWANNFIKQLLSIREHTESIHSEQIDVSKVFKIKPAYQTAKKRLIMLDYDGTLSPFKKLPEDAYPTPRILSLLKKLKSDKKNKLVISSGRDQKTLEKWFGESGIYLAAEHGTYFKDEAGWHSKISTDEAWDDDILNILNMFTDKTPRSFIEEKQTTLVWHYRNVDAWLATLREQQLINALIEPCTRLGLQVMRGNKIVEIKSPLYTKGSEAKRLLELDDYDFIMAIGDDTTDEDMFRVLPDSAFTIKVGSVSPLARYNLRSQSRVLPFINKLIMDE